MTQQEREADPGFAYIVNTTADTMKITMEEATTRVRALYELGILETGHPDDPDTQMRITAFLSIPSEKYAHLTNSADGNQR